MSTETTDSTTDESDAQAGETSGIQKINFQPSVSRRNANRYALSFHRETVKELKAQRDAARKPIEFTLRSNLETGDEYFQGFDFPVRPKWSFDMSKEQVDRNENRYFTVKSIRSLNIYFYHEFPFFWHISIQKYRFYSFFWSFVCLFVICRNML